MEYRFSWKSTVSEDIRSWAEESIRDTQESGHSPIVFCHSGPVIITLTSSDPIQDTIAGNMRCSCGIPRGIVKGKVGAARMILEAVPD